MKKGLALAAALIAIGALATGCSPSAPAAQSDAGMSQSASSKPVPPSPGCAAMDQIVYDTLAGTPEGRAFTQALEAKEASNDAWLAYTRMLRTDYFDDLAEAAADDEYAKNMLNAFDSYMSTSELLASGALKEFTDPAQAEDDIKAGREPERNPEYSSAVETRANAHNALSECMPNWPVLF